MTINSNYFTFLQNRNPLGGLHKVKSDETSGVVEKRELGKSPATEKKNNLENKINEATMQKRTLDAKKSNLVCEQREIEWPPKPVESEFASQEDFDKANEEYTRKKEECQQKNNEYVKQIKELNQKFIELTNDIQRFSNDIKQAETEIKAEEEARARAEEEARARAEEEAKAKAEEEAKAKAEEEAKAKAEEEAKAKAEEEAKAKAQNEVNANEVSGTRGYSAPEEEENRKGSFDAATNLFVSTTTDPEGGVTYESHDYDGNPVHSYHVDPEGNSTEKQYKNGALSQMISTTVNPDTGEETISVTTYEHDPRFPDDPDKVKIKGYTKYSREEYNKYLKDLDNQENKPAEESHNEKVLNDLRTALQKEANSLEWQANQDGFGPSAPGSDNKQLDRINDILDKLYSGEYSDVTSLAKLANELKGLGIDPAEYGLVTTQTDVPQTQIAQEPNFGTHDFDIAGVTIPEGFSMKNGDSYELNDDGTVTFTINNSKGKTSKEITMNGDKEVSTTEYKYKADGSLSEKVTTKTFDDEDYKPSEIPEKGKLKVEKETTKTEDGTITLQKEYDENGNVVCIIKTEVDKNGNVTESIHYMSESESNTDSKTKNDKQNIKIGKHGNGGGGDDYGFGNSHEKDPAIDEDKLNSAWDWDKQINYDPDFKPGTGGGGGHHGTVSFDDWDWYNNPWLLNDQI